MAWNRQNFKKKRDDSGDLVELDGKLKGVKFDEAYVQTFLEDWKKCRERHPAQKEVQEAFFSGDHKYIFVRCGRKWAKTTCLIDFAWEVCNRTPGVVCFICYPTISLGLEVVWEERRLQKCDIKEEYMFERYVKKTDDNKHILTFNNGSYIKLIGTWTEAKGRGTQPDLLLIDEVQDCNPAFLNAMDSNLAAKDHSRCVMAGTPSPTPSHYQKWEKRIINMPKGKAFHYSSYANTALPHLKQWLDDKKIELTKSGELDIWDREYMAVDNFSSAERILPDALFDDKQLILNKATLAGQKDLIPILAISIQGKYFCAIMGLLNPKKNIYITDVMLVPQIWCRSFGELYPILGPKVKELQDLCNKRLRKLVWDESGAFTDVITGFSKCRKDAKWQDRGLPLLRELMISNKIAFSQDIGDFGLECQNMLVDESIKDIQKKYPYSCTLAMLVNEYFQRDKIMPMEFKEFDKFHDLREQGIICPAPNSKKRIFGFNLK